MTQALVNDLGMSLIDAEQTKREVGLAEETGPMAPAIRIMSRAALELIEEIRGSLDYYSATSTNGSVTPGRALRRRRPAARVPRTARRSPASTGGGRVDSLWPVSRGHWALAGAAQLRRSDRGCARRSCPRGCVMRLSRGRGGSPEANEPMETGDVEFVDAATR